jgi:hypothetical protein
MLIAINKMYRSFFILIIVAGCSGKTDHSVLPGTPKMSNAQAFLSDLKDSMISQFHSTGSETKKQDILERYHQRLEDYLIHHHVDSMKVTIDEVITKGRTITTKSHYSNIEFEYGLTFNGSMSPGIDSIYEFMKGLKEGSDTLANFSFTGACQVNSPDSAKLWTFRIYAFPVPLQYTGH